MQDWRETDSEYEPCSVGKEENGRVNSQKKRIQGRLPGRDSL